MKVLLVNGSPHKNGCTHRALQEIQMQLKKEQLILKFFGLEALSKDVSDAVNVKKAEPVYLMIF